MQSAFARKWMKASLWVLAALACLALAGLVIHGLDLCTGGPFSGFNEGTSRPWSCAYSPDWLGALTGEAAIIMLFFWWAIVPICLAIWLLPPAIAEAIARMRVRKDNARMRKE
ncbi:hypothetical protein [Gymnodinialimonas hymeniacidonis]|uniref:hypothetical protein n=1 Tax=Gymnodinialimonas hymeniacidonis TaxID=3126508 RepID=UPI0034C5BF01